MEHARGLRLLIPAEGPDRRAVEGALAWVIDRVEAGRRGVVVVPTLAQLDHGVLADLLGADGVEIARRDRMLRQRLGLPPRPGARCRQRESCPFPAAELEGYGACLGIALRTIPSNIGGAAW